MSLHQTGRLIHQFLRPLLHPLRKSVRSRDERLQRRYEERISITNPALHARFLTHVETWYGCTDCPLCRNRKYAALFRGHLPCDVLFIGEAPGDSEDATGYPFIGPAGSLLDDLRKEAWLSIESGRRSAGDTSLITWGITNIVACLPTEKQELSSPTVRAPNKQEAEACSPRLGEIIVLARPRLVVTLGVAAKRFINIVLPVPQPPGTPRVIHLIHPASILHSSKEGNASQQRVMEKRFVITLAEAIKELCK